VSVEQSLTGASTILIATIGTVGPLSIRSSVDSIFAHNRSPPLPRFHRGKPSSMMAARPKPSPLDLNVCPSTSSSQMWAVIWKYSDRFLVDTDANVMSMNSGSFVSRKNNDVPHVEHLSTGESEALVIRMTKAVDSQILWLHDLMI